MAKILIADQDPDERELIIFALRFAGHKMVSVFPTAGGFAQVTGSLSDLFLLDAGLLLEQRVNSWDALLKEKVSAGKRVAILVHEGQEALVQDRLALDNLVFIYRPISPDPLTRTVNEILGTARK